MPNVRFVLPAGASALRDIKAPPVNFGQTASDLWEMACRLSGAFLQTAVRRGLGDAGEPSARSGHWYRHHRARPGARGCRVTGLDSEQHLLTEAARLDREAATGVTYVQGRAEATGLPAASFDLVTAGQCWHWFDRPATVAEVARVLLPGGRLVIAHFDWLALRDNVVAMTERLVERYNPDWHLGYTSGLYPPWLTDVAEGGFDALETFSFDVPVTYTHEAWRGRIRASAGIGASLSPESVSLFDAHLEAELKQNWPSEPLIVPHRVWALKAEWPG